MAAFIAVGGGSAGQFLDQFGISLSELANAGEAGAGSGPVPVAPDGEPARPGDEALFDQTGRLRANQLDPVVATAVRVAALLASQNRTAISTSMLLYGLAVAGSEALGDGLREQGDAGTTAFHRMSALNRAHRNRFSSRTRRVLQRSAADSGTVDEAALLREILAEPTSSAREFLATLGVDAERLLASAALQRGTG